LGTVYKQLEQVEKEDSDINKKETTPKPITE
jgi:hypothetical protein